VTAQTSRRIRADAGGGRHHPPAVPPGLSVASPSQTTTRQQPRPALIGGGTASRRQVTDSMRAPPPRSTRSTIAGASAARSATPAASPSRVRGDSLKRRATSFEASCRTQSPIAVAGRLTSARHAAPTIDADSGSLAVALAQLEAAASPSRSAPPRAINDLLDTVRAEIVPPSGGGAVTVSALTNATIDANTSHQRRGSAGGPDGGFYSPARAPRLTRSRTTTAAITGTRSHPAAAVSIEATDRLSSHRRRTAAAANRGRRAAGGGFKNRGGRVDSRQRDPRKPRAPCLGATIGRRGPTAP